MAPAVIESEISNGTYESTDTSTAQRTPECAPLADVKVVMVTGGAGFM